MAIDSAEKRRSAAGTAFGGGVLLPGVTPNTTKDAEWRQQAAWSYSGILAEAPLLTILGGQWVTGGSYHPGFQVGSAYHAAFQAGGSFLDGFRNGDSYTDGFRDGGSYSSGFKEGDST